MLGLPGSGKSTFIAALWEVVRSSAVPQALKLERLIGDSTYVVRLHREWSAGRPLPRTNMGQEGSATILLRDNSATPARISELFLPDLSGESFDIQWEGRFMSVGYQQHIQSSSGIMIFIHSQKINKGALLAYQTEELDKIFDLDETTENEFLEVADNNMQPEVNIPDINEVEFNPARSPTQTKIVDLLQQTLVHSDCGIRRIAVIVSAWDLVQGQNTSPAAWVEKELPLLSQFLSANNKQLTFRIYGVSAQGGELDQDTTNQLLGKSKPAERIIVVDGNETNHNITAPIQWLSQE